MSNCQIFFCATKPIERQQNFVFLDYLDQHYNIFVEEYWQRKVGNNFSKLHQILLEGMTGQWSIVFSIISWTVSMEWRSPKMRFLAIAFDLFISKTMAITFFEVFVEISFSSIVICNMRLAGRKVVNMFVF